MSFQLQQFKGKYQTRSEKKTSFPPALWIAKKILFPKTNSCFYWSAFWNLAKIHGQLLLLYSLIMKYTYIVAFFENKYIIQLLLDRNNCLKALQISYRLFLQSEQVAMHGIHSIAQPLPRIPWPIDTE